MKDAFRALGVPNASFMAECVHPRVAYLDGEPAGFTEGQPSDPATGS